MKGHHHNQDLAEGDELAVAWRKDVQRLATGRKMLPAAEGDGHAMAVELQPDLSQHAEHHQLDHSPIKRVHDAVARARDDQREHAVHEDV